MQSQLDYEALFQLFDWPNGYINQDGKIETKNQCKSMALVMKADDPRLVEEKIEPLHLQIWDRNSMNYRPADYNSKN